MASSHQCHVKLRTADSFTLRLVVTRHYADRSVALRK